MLNVHKLVTMNCDAIRDKFDFPVHKTTIKLYQRPPKDSKKQIIKSEDEENSPRK